MKILITAANQAKAYELAWLLKDKNTDLVFADDRNQKLRIARESSPSYAHELLNFCLNEGIDYVFPLKGAEVKALAEAKVLFDEYGIGMAIPDLLTLKKMHSLEGLSPAHRGVYQIAGTFPELSSKMIAMGYPDQKLAIAPADDDGNILLIDDATGNFNAIWKQMKAMSFIQTGKLLNSASFSPLKIFAISKEADLIQANVLLWEQELLCPADLEEDTLKLIREASSTYQLQGFFQFSINGNTVLRITPYHL